MGDGAAESDWHHISPQRAVLILEKDTGQVKVMDGKSITGTARSAGGQRQRGRIAGHCAPRRLEDHFVYLYYTAAAKDGGTPISNSIKRYVWNGSTLTLTKRSSIFRTHRGRITMAARWTSGRTENFTSSSAS